MEAKIKIMSTDSINESNEELVNASVAHEMSLSNNKLRKLVIRHIDAHILIAISLGKLKLKISDDFPLNMLTTKIVENDENGLPKEKLIINDIELPSSLIKGKLSYWYNLLLPSVKKHYEDKGYVVSLLDGYDIEFSW